MAWHPLKCPIFNIVTSLGGSAFLSWSCVHATIKRAKGIEILGPGRFILQILWLMKKGFPGVLKFCVFCPATRNDCGIALNQNYDFELSAFPAYVGNSEILILGLVPAGISWVLF